MEIRRIRQIIKTFSDDTRLRIIALLHAETLNVTDLCKIVGKSQSNISKHLARLRLTGLVSDKRQGQNVFYFLRKSANDIEDKLVNSLTSSLSATEIFKKDIEALNKIRKKNKSSCPPATAKPSL
ncbi:MAG: winged helix-turn-helix transcriptional regulator [Candidatus Omnitrophica bacterium]|nr:winged helix-turn-helix transcriptional regulator [Candidatus Omnitrophota bacterium]